MPDVANQVFQYAYTATREDWPVKAKVTSTAYLWIPEDCKRVRGLVILCNNVPEHRLAGDPLIREVCARQGLGIVWCAPSFMSFAKEKDVAPGKKPANNAEAYDISTGFLQQLVTGLAEVSGYDEVATVPWLPMGESGHLLMVDALVEAMPERCIAGVFIKNNHYAPKNRTVPQLVIYGTSQEWSQDKADIRTKWNSGIEKVYEGILQQRKRSPEWPLSYAIDGSSGHFDCSPEVTKLIASYIDEAASARLSKDPKAPLKAVETSSGFVADLPVPGRLRSDVLAYAAAPDKTLPWYFGKGTAKAAQDIAAINWQAKTQFIGFLDTEGKVMPYDFNGISNLKKVNWEDDGLTFSVRPVLLDKIPDGFVGAGEPLEKTPGEPTIEWQCGSLQPLGNNRFRVSLDRTWRIATYLIGRKQGNADVRTIVQPLGVDMNSLRNGEGKAQKITFEPINDVSAGAESVELNASSDSGLTVSFFVVSGPATVQGNKLVLTKVPPRAKYPAPITVAAWQWGSAKEPKYKMADVVKQTFHLTAGPTTPGVAR